MKCYWDTPYVASPVSLGDLYVCLSPPALFHCTLPSSLKRISSSPQQGSACNEAFVFVLWADAVLNWIGCSLPTWFLLPSCSQHGSSFLHYLVLSSPQCSTLCPSTHKQVFWVHANAHFQVPAPDCIMCSTHTPYSVCVCVCAWSDVHVFIVIQWTAPPLSHHVSGPY